MYLFTEIEIKSENEIYDITLVRKKENEREFLIKKGKFQVNFE
jgi:hypothetical protein